MSEKKIKWYKVADSKEAIGWQTNRMVIVEAAGKKVTLAKHNNEIFAFAHKCPHASGVLADGFIDAAGNLACPLHRYRFNISNGRNVSGEGYYLKVYATEEREAGVFVGFEENKWLNIPGF
jgi:3-phenylpropionate/trans-cinnamate dioxygenase ferredoxin subunit